VAGNFRRRAQHRRELSGCDADIAGGCSPEGALAEAETQACIHEMIDTLPPPLRDVFVLAEIEGFSVREIAAALQVPPTTVRSRLQHGREAFFTRANRRHKAGKLLAVLALLQDDAQPISPLRSAASRLWQHAGAAAIGAGLVAAWFCVTREPPPPVHIEREAPVLAQNRWFVVPDHTALPDPSAPDRADRAALGPPRAGAADRPLYAGGPSTFQEEVAMIDSARSAMNEGRDQEGLGHLLRHKLRYPNGAMSALRDQLIREVHAPAQR
jgi:hypothetical protein